MSPDAILTSVMALVAAAVASAATAWLVRRGEERAAVGTSARHDTQIAAMQAQLSEIRAESARQWAELRAWMERITVRMDGLDARLTRLEARLDERDRRGEETRRAIVGESLDAMQAWCSERCDVRRRAEGSVTDPRIPRYHGEILP